MAQCYRNSGSLKNGMAAQAHRTSGSFAPRLFTTFKPLCIFVLLCYHKLLFLSSYCLFEFSDNFSNQSDTTPYTTRGTNRNPPRTVKEPTYLSPWYFPPQNHFFKLFKIITIPTIAPASNAILLQENPTCNSLIVPKTINAQIAPTIIFATG